VAQRSGSPQGGVSAARSAPSLVGRLWPCLGAGAGAVDNLGGGELDGTRRRHSSLADTSRLPAASGNGDLCQRQTPIRAGQDERHVEPAKSLTSSKKGLVLDGPREHACQIVVEKHGSPASPGACHLQRTLAGLAAALTRMQSANTMSPCVSAVCTTPPGTVVSRLSPGGEDDDEGLVGTRLRGSCSILLVGQPASQQSSGKRRCRRGPSLQDHVDQRVRGSNEQSHKGRPMRVRDKR